jgi:hypothetical protein
VVAVISRLYFRPEAAVVTGGPDMGIIGGLIGSVITLIALVVIMLLLAALFMIIFGNATGIDDRIND